MASVNDGLISILMDVALEGTATIDKRKLLWLMGRSNAKASAWRILLDNWEEIGMKADDLYATEIDGKVVLLRHHHSEISTVEKWAV